MIRSLHFQVVTIFVIVLIVGCARTKDANLGEDPAVVAENITSIDTTSIPINGRFDVSSYLVSENAADTSQTQIIDYDCAVLVFPDEKQLADMKKEYGEEDFAIIADDNSWYQGSAISLLDSLGIHKVTINKPYVAFYGEMGVWTLNLRKNGALEWNLLFFSKKKKPMIVSTVDLNAEDVYSYFNQKGG